jgi:hypothetical protein
MGPFLACRDHPTWDGWEVGAGRPAGGAAGGRGQGKRRHGPLDRVRLRCPYLSWVRASVPGVRRLLSGSGRQAGSGAQVPHVLGREGDEGEEDVLQQVLPRHSATQRGALGNAAEAGEQGAGNPA